MPAAFRNNHTQIPQYIDEQLRFQHQMNIEAQREHLLNRGFPITHPLIQGEIPLHPELVGQLHFDLPSRTTLPLGPDDYRRFMPEMTRFGFNQPAAASRDHKVARQTSRRENSFVGSSKKKGESHQEGGNKLFSWFGGGNSKHNKEDLNRNNLLDHHQWMLRERDDLKSMPPVHISDDYTRAAGAGLERNDKDRASFGMILKDKFQKNPNMYFPDTERRSPSKISNNKPDKLKEKLHDSLSDTDTLIHNMSEGSFDKESSSLSGRGHSTSSRSSGKSS